MKKILSPTEGESGEQGGKLLASYLVLKKDEFMPIQRFGGVVGFLEANLSTTTSGARWRAQRARPPSSCSTRSSLRRYSSRSSPRPRARRRRAT